MLFDTLGVVVGFITVMLVLSLLVTTITSALDKMLRLRPRNLEFVLTALFEDVLRADGPPGPASDEPGDMKPLDAVELPERVAAEARALASRLVQSSRYQPETDGASMIGKVGARVAPAPSLTKLDLKMVTEGLAYLGRPLSEKERRQLERQFGEAQASIRARFERNVKGVAMVVAALVAFALQVSAPDLVARLSSDASLRAAAVELGVGLADASAAPDSGAPGESGDGSSLSYTEFADGALKELQKQWPDAAELIEQASGLDAPRQTAWQSRRYVVEELDLILEEADHPQREAIVAAYEALLDAERLTSLRHAADLIRQRQAELAMLDIRFWKGGWGFYSDIENWVGVAITAILISLGAPFWHDALRRTVSLLQRAPGHGEREAAIGSQNLPANTKSA